MARSRNRVCLQDGLKLDLNGLIRRGFVQRGHYSGVRGIGWTHSYWGEVASALISADLSDTSSGWLKLEGGLNQFILLAAQPEGSAVTSGTSYAQSPAGQPRSSGDRQVQSASVAGAWKHQVAYATQFLDRDNRAHHGQSKINARLCFIGKLDREEWDFPPKPKWMRWKTYRRYERRFDRYDAVLDSGIIELAAKLCWRT